MYSYNVNLDCTHGSKSYSWRYNKSKNDFSLIQSGWNKCEMDTKKYKKPKRITDIDLKNLIKIKENKRCEKWNKSQIKCDLFHFSIK